MNWLKAVLLFVLAAGGRGYKIFQDGIPNGGLIPHPCKPSYRWPGVGHLNLAGGGARNSFGQDFDKNGKKWDTCLCETDSDGDGKTNGEELGDPLCRWRPGAAPQRTTGLSHPGICEPLDDPVCVAENRKFGDICEGGEGINPCVEDIKQNPDTLVWNITFPVTPVPAEETTYMCQTFEFPHTDTDYHAVAMHPHLDNRHVMHHMLMYGCTEDIDTMTAPTECEMALYGCFDLLFFWGIGVNSNGQCLNDKFGFKLGLHGYKKILIQTHWNNPMLVDDYTDGSGLVIFYTPQLREYDGASLMIGQNFVAVPPHRRETVVEGTCTSECTHSFPGPIHITESLVHMHYLGSKGYIHHTRQGHTVTDLVIQDEYYYDSPIIFQHDPPVEFLPGDEFHTLCHYKSTTKDEYTYRGDGTSAEMCYGFLQYYPAMPHFPHCVQHLSQSYCVVEDWSDFLGCNETWFWKEKGFETFLAGLSASCDETGLTCTPECLDLLDTLAQVTPCFHGDPLVNNKHRFNQEGRPEVFRMIDSCAERPEEENWTEPDDDEDDNASGDGQKVCDGNYPRVPADGSVLYAPLSLIMMTLNCMLVF